MRVFRALEQTGLVRSLAEGRRVIAQGAVKVDGIIVDDIAAQLPLGRCLIQAGTRSVVYDNPDPPVEEA